MMRLVLRKILIRMTLMHSVIAVNTMTRKLRLFTLGREIIIRQLVDLSAVIHTQEEDLIRLV